MTGIVCDASVVLKWFVSENEPEVDAARTLLAAHRKGRINAMILDLTLYEIGNVLSRVLGWPAAAVGDQLDDLLLICRPTGLAGDERRRAADLAERHRLTFYDAAYAAVAAVRGLALATADDALLRAGVGEPAGALVERLGLGGSV